MIQLFPAAVNALSFPENGAKLEFMELLDGAKAFSLRRR
jgi:hypothetical protein